MGQFEKLRVITYSGVALIMKVGHRSREHDSWESL